MQLVRPNRGFNSRIDTRSTEQKRSSAAAAAAAAAQRSEGSLTAATVG